MDDENAEDALPNDEEGDGAESDENDEMALNEGDALGEDVEDVDEGEPPVPPRPEPLADGSCEAHFNWNSVRTMAVPPTHHPSLVVPAVALGLNESFAYRCLKIRLYVSTPSAPILTLYCMSAPVADDGRGEVQCNDDFAGLQSRVTFRADAEAEYFVIVDSYNVSGQFVVNVSEGACR